MFTPEDVKKIARLSRLEIQESELEKFTGQMNQILGFIDSLNKLDTTHIEPTSHAAVLATVFREDECIPSEVSELALEAAPEAEDHFFKVPKVIG